MKFSPVRILLISLFVLAPLNAPAQSAATDESTPLADLLAEAEKNNPQIQAARHSLESARQVPTQVATLPDPKVALQQVNVGSPRPFAGFTNSDFAFIGLGVSQDFPYPGKLHLRGEIAKKDADATQQKMESVCRAVLADVKTAYFRLAYLAKRRKILDDDAQMLQQVEQAAESRYRNGVGNQQEVLQAQLERTKLARELTNTQLESGKLQAELKKLLSRSQSSADIATAELSESAPDYSFDQLLAEAKTNDPDIAAAQKIVERQDLQVDLAKKDFYPDFNAQFMWQRTDPSQYRAYYQFTIGMNLPLYRGRRLRPQLAQAESDRNSAKSEYQMQSQQTAFQLRQAFLTAEKSAELLKIYREGLIPQARAELQAGMAAYQSNRQDFQALLASFLDVLKLDDEYWQTLSEHETALARIGELTGVTLR
jgi:outer membrane protein TolC